VSFVGRFLDWQRNARHDWVFLSFLSLAVVVSSFTGVQRVRYARALTNFDVCAALGDAACASAELETARSIDADQPRTHIAHAQLRAVLGEAAAAEQSLSQALARPSLLQRLVGPPKATSAPSAASASPPSARRGEPPASNRVSDATPVPLETLDSDSEAIAHLDRATRGEVMLTLGDIAALKGEQQRARARWTEASALVDAAALVKPRLDRVSSREEAGLASVSAELDQLRADFETFFGAVLDGAQSVDLQVRDLNGRVRKIGNEAARNKLSLAIDAGERCVEFVRRKRHDTDPILNPVESTYKPTPPTMPRSHQQWAQEQYQRDLANYQRSLERAEGEERKKAYKRSAQLDELTAKVGSMMDEARSLAKEGFALAALSGGAAGTAAR
jgi:hypothetical protein